MARAILAIICLAAAAAGFLAGCQDNPAAPADAGVVMALDVGNTWHYAVRDNEPGAPVTSVNRTITGHREISYDGRTLTVAVEMPVPAAGKFLASTGRLLRNEDDGLYTYGRVDSEGGVEVTGRALVAPRDGRPGDRFDYGGGRFLVCVAVDSLIVTDFGEVAADVYELSLDEGTVRVPDVYVVPGVGLTRYYNLQWTGWLVGYEFP